MSTLTPMLDSYRELVDAVQRSRGWYNRIVQESGCRYQTLRRIANEPAYRPKIDEVERIRNWFRAHGVPTRHPAAAPRDDMPPLAAGE
jgi:hypothetical protein